MAFTKKMNVVLVDFEEISFTDKTNGEKITKIKYTFVDQNNNLINGYSDTHKPELEKKLVNTDRYADELAVETEWVGRTYMGETSWKLV